MEVAPKACDHKTLQGVRTERVLFVNAKTKSIGFAGEFEKCSHKAVVVAEKKPLSQNDIEGLNLQTRLTQNFTNDIYAQYDASGPPSIGDLKVIVISPATDAHVQKYLDRDLHFIHETPEDYESVTKPFIQKQILSIDVSISPGSVYFIIIFFLPVSPCDYFVSLSPTFVSRDNCICTLVVQWVYNILDGRSESDRIICNDPDPADGFVLLPDMKWDVRDMESLYLLAIARRRDLPSMRELRKEHLPLLKNILVKGKVTFL